MRIKKSLFVSACAWTLVVPQTALASGTSMQTFGGEHGTLSPPSKSPDSGGKYIQQVGALEPNASYAL